MSNAIFKIQQELDKVRNELTTALSKAARLDSSEKNLEAAMDVIEKLNREQAEKLGEAKTEATIRAKEQIETLTAENKKLKEEAVRNAELLQQTGDEVKEMVQRVKQAELTMKNMAAEHQAPKPKVAAAPRFRRSQRS